VGVRALVRFIVVGLAIILLPSAQVSGAANSAAVDDIRRQTAQVRQLIPIEDVPLEVVDRAAIRSVLERGVSRVGVGPELGGIQRLYATLGLIPSGFDLRAGLLDILTAQVDGLYEPSEKRVYLVSSAAELSVRGKIILAHELAHAIQDQHFDLQQLLPDAPDNADRSAAIQALVEGDALVTQLRWGRQFLTPGEKLSLGEDTSDAPGSLAAPPLVVRTALSFPYTDGAAFVHLMLDRGGYAAVNQAFQEPPQSTEQVLHPAKYVAREGARQVRMPDLAGALGGSWRTVRSNVLGELGIRVLLEQFSGPEAAAVGAEGWGGDVYAVLEDSGGRVTVAINTLWDSESDAAEFYNAFLSTVPGRFGSAALRARDEPSLVRWATPQGAILVIKTDDRVRIIYGPDGFAAEIVNAEF
jgi:hypothetical protein